MNHGAEWAETLVILTKSLPTGTVHCTKTKYGVRSHTTAGLACILGAVKT